jgi:hypothetical protein
LSKGDIIKSVPKNTTFAEVSAAILQPTAITDNSADYEARWRDVIGCCLQAEENKRKGDL